MTYEFQEGSLDIIPTADRTLNMLTLKDAGGTELNLVMARERIEAGETLEQCVARQLNTLRRQVTEVKENSRRAYESAKYPFFILEAELTQHKQKVYQGHAFFRMAPEHLLIMTLSSPKPFDDALRETWYAILKGFTPRED